MTPAGGDPCKGVGNSCGRRVRRRARAGTPVRRP